MDAVLTYLHKGGPVMWPLILGAIWLYYAITRYCLHHWQHPPVSPGKNLQEQDLTTVRETLESIQRNLRLIRVLTYILPLLGLLGTVMGMVTTFNGMSELAYRTGSGNGNVSSGIAEALLTTQTGLVFAIPALVFQTFIYRHRVHLRTTLRILSLET